MAPAGCDELSQLPAALVYLRATPGGGNVPSRGPELGGAQLDSRPGHFISFVVFSPFNSITLDW